MSIAYIFVSAASLEWTSKATLDKSSAKVPLLLRWLTLKASQARLCSKVDASSGRMQNRWLRVPGRMRNLVTNLDLDEGSSHEEMGSPISSSIKLVLAGDWWPTITISDD